MSNFKECHFSSRIILWAVRWCWKPKWVSSWQIDEIVDIYLSTTRNAEAAKRFLSKALRSIKSYNHPSTLNTDKDKAYIPAILALREDGVSPSNIHHR